MQLIIYMMIYACFGLNEVVAPSSYMINCCIYDLIFKGVIPGTLVNEVIKTSFKLKIILFILLRI